MKTLKQVEPRIPITSVPLTITQSGSYYLTGNLQITAGDNTAISIQANDVTLDLMGYRLKGSGGAISEIGVLIDGHSNVEVRNGIIEGFSGSAVNSQAGSVGCRLTNLRVSNGFLNGLAIFGTGHVVDGCVVSGYDAGIYASEGCIITNNIICNNKTGIAFATGNCYIHGNMLFGNTTANMATCSPPCTLGNNHMF